MRTTLERMAAWLKSHQLAVIELIAVAGLTYLAMLEGLDFWPALLVAILADAIVWVLSLATFLPCIIRKLWNQHHRKE